ncbi:6-bladed beta-propeller [Lutibacter sp.]
MISLIFFCIYTHGNTQETRLSTEKNTIVEEYSIKWVHQFPSVKKYNNPVPKNWLLTLLLGKKNTYRVTKPMAIIATDSSTFSILDQGSNTIFNVKNEHFKIPKILRKNKNSFPSLIDFCRLPTNGILFTDSRLNKIYHMNEKQKILTIFNDSILLEQPTGIAYSEVSNEIWVVETKAHKISILNEKGNLIKTIGKRGTKLREFNFPTSIWIDKLGNAYVIDTMNFRVQVFDRNGKIISVFGEIGNATGYFARPKGIATDSHGNIYISDALFHTVQIFDISGNFLYQFGKQGRGQGEFWIPSGIYIDDKDFIYVADSYNSRIQIFQLIKK